MAKKMGDSIFVCSNCGNEFGKWAGQCPACGEWNTLKEVTAKTTFGGGKTKSGKIGGGAVRVEAVKLPEVKISEINSGNNAINFSSTISEFDRVLGKGITQGGVVLFAGEPGIGKSTLLTQIISKVGGVYVAGEESAEQIGLRLSRLGLSSKGIQFLETTDIDSIVSYLDRVENVPKLVVIDSIQVMATADMTGGAGSVSQIRESTFRLVQIAKAKRMAMIIVGHVTKEGEIAGPRLLEHMVDVVLYLEGDRTSDFRILRAYKNRFGPTDEVGVFRMEEGGMKEMRGEDLMFVESNTPLPGSALTVVMDGTRPALVEIQALVTESFAPQPRRVFAGIPYDRGQLMCAVAQKVLNLPLYKFDVFLSVTGGIKIVDTAADLGIVAAIFSSFNNSPLGVAKKQNVFVGEVSLLGNVRKPRQYEKRVKEAQSLGRGVANINNVSELKRVK